MIEMAKLREVIAVRDIPKGDYRACERCGKAFRPELKRCPHCNGETVKVLEKHLEYDLER
jgi:uncharacterized OB-fold protein